MDNVVWLLLAALATTTAARSFGSSAADDDDERQRQLIDKCFFPRDFAPSRQAGSRLFAAYAFNLDTLRCNKLELAFDDAKRLKQYLHISSVMCDRDCEAYREDIRLILQGVPVGSSASRRPADGSPTRRLPDGRTSPQVPTIGRASTRQPVVLITADGDDDRTGFGRDDADADDKGRYMTATYSVHNNVALPDGGDGGQIVVQDVQNVQSDEARAKKSADDDKSETKQLASQDSGAAATATNQPLVALLSSLLTTLLVLIGRR